MPLKRDRTGLEVPYQEDGTEWAKRLKIGRLVSDVFVFLLPASLLAAIVATHINPVVTPGFTEPQRVLESSAGFIILPPVVMASLIALYIECLAEPAVAHIIARGRTSASKASWGQSRTLAMFGRGLLLSATTALYKSAHQRDWRCGAIAPIADLFRRRVYGWRRLCEVLWAPAVGGYPG